MDPIRHGRARQHMARLYAEDPQRFIDRSQQWRADNREKSRPSRLLENDRRRAKVRGAYVDRIYRKVVWERDCGICHLCGTVAELDNWHLDHIVPLSRGGMHSYENVAVSHPACNLRKHTKLVSELREAQDD